MYLSTEMIIKSMRNFQSSKSTFGMKNKSLVNFKYVLILQNDGVSCSYNYKFFDFNLIFLFLYKYIKYYVLKFEIIVGNLLI